MSVIIIGGGISGLSLAYFLLERNPSLDITVLEAEKKAGGKIWTDKTEGFLCEGGVNGFLDNRPKTLELAANLSLEPLRSSDNARKRYIFSNGRLNRLPESPPAFFSSNLLSVTGRLRIILEMVVPKWNGGDETLAHFAQRRLGREAYEKLIDPMASGIFAGDPEKMSLKSCFPKVFNLEQKYGSLIRGMIKLQKEAKRTGKKVGAGPGGVLTSFHEGMETMINALTDFLGTRIKTGSPAVAIEKNSKGYIVYLRDGTRLEASGVVCATPAFNTAELVENLDKKLASILREIFYPSISVVCLGYRKEKIRRSLDGFGFLIPFREGRNILGTLWDSSIFPNRAPEGHVLLRTMLGGARRSALAEENEEKLINLVMEELQDIMEISAQPDFARVYTHRKGIPQYPAGHENRLQLIDNIINKISKLYITGNAYHGIGVNDCIENSYKLAETIVKGI